MCTLMETTERLRCEYCFHMMCEPYMHLNSDDLHECEMPGVEVCRAKWFWLIPFCIIMLFIGFIMGKCD